MKQDTAIQVLVIEDDVRIAEINRRFVERVDGYQVVGIATNEPEAKEHLAILHPDLVLLDIYFPDMDGFELLQFPETLSRYRSFRKRLDALMKENPKVDQQAIDELMQSIEPKNWLQSYDGPEIFRVFGRARSGTSLILLMASSGAQSGFIGRYSEHSRGRDWQPALVSFVRWLMSLVSD